jgi:antitoxin MazE
MKENSMLRTSVRRVGNSLGITLPKTVVENYRLSEGDELHLIETDEGLMLTPYSPKFRAWAEAYERTNKKFRNTLRSLAK